MLTPVCRTSVNIGVVARSPALLPYLRAQVTAEAVGRHFEHKSKSTCLRYDLPGLNAMNFLLHESLGGGGTLSLLLDAQGKTYAQYLLCAEVSVDTGLVECVERLYDADE